MSHFSLLNYILINWSVSWQALLPTIQTWEEKVEILLASSEDESSKDYQRRAINECKARIESVINYDPENAQKRKIESKVL